MWVRVGWLALVLGGCAPQAGPHRLMDDVTVTVDAQGISHIQALSEHDVFFAQGYVTARDRMFQMDLVRRRAWGTRAEVLGEDHLQGDVLSRTLRFGDWAEDTETALRRDDPLTYAVLEAYAAGVNAFLADAETGAGGMSLSPQFDAVGYSPAQWTVTDTLAIEKLITAGLSMRPDQDIILGLLKMLLGDALFTDIYQYRPFDADYIVPDFYAEAPVRPADPAVERRRVARPEGLDDAALAQAIQAAQGLNLSMGGSNAFAVSGTHTASGHAMLASDSHQGVEHPAVYYLVHLDTVSTGGSLDVVGATFPGVPMVMFGHNGTIAWGSTTNIFDAADAWLEVFADNAQTQVLFDGDAVPLEFDTVEIRVRPAGGAVEDAQVQTLERAVVPHHGPLLATEAMGLPLPLSVSLRWTGYQARSVAPVFYDLSKATDFDTWRGALDGYFTGGQHFVYADVSGHIGYSGYSDVPLREQVDPDAPPVTLLPGEGGYEWLPSDGQSASPYAHLTPDQVPWVLDPADGIITAANNDPAGLTDDNDPFDDAVYLSGVFDIGTRSLQPRAHLEARLDAVGALELADLETAQNDGTSRLAVRLLPYLLDAAARRPDLVDDRAAQALALLAEWDHDCGVDQAAPTVFHAWLVMAGRDVLADDAGALSDTLFTDLDGRVGLVLAKFLIHWLDATAADIDALDAGDAAFPSASGRNFFDDAGTEAVETRDEVLLGALDAALDGLEEVFLALVATGESTADVQDPATWRWGDVHQMGLVDHAEPWLDGASVAPQAKAGGLYTVDVADFQWLEDGGLPGTWLVDNAASNRFVYELDPSGVVARMVLPGGQSERPDSPWHASMYADFLGGTYMDVPFAVDEVAAQGTEVYVLPAGFPVTPRED